MDWTCLSPNPHEKHSNTPGFQLESVSPVPIVLSLVMVSEPGKLLLATKRLVVSMAKASTGADRLGFHASSAWPVPVASSLARKLLDWPPTLLKLPAMKTLASWSTMAVTGPSAPGTQV